MIELASDAARALVGAFGAVSATACDPNVEKVSRGGSIPPLRAVMVVVLLTMTMRSGETPRPPRDASFRCEALPWLPHVARYARVLARDPADADDLVQETFLRAYNAWDSYQPGTSCRSWLFTICRNVHLRGVQRDARMYTTDDPDAESVASAGLYHYAAGRGLDTVFDRVDLRDAVQDAIATLPAEYRDVVLLVDVQDLPYGEAASALGIPLGTVRSRLFRARRLLQAQLIAFAEDAGFRSAPNRALERPTTEDERDSATA